MGITCNKSSILFQYTLNGLPISKVNSTKYLGVKISSNLSWNVHVDNICKNANSTLGLLRRVLAVVAIKFKTRHTVLLYSLNSNTRPVYGIHSGNINKIESVQRRAARYVFNDYSHYSHVTPMVQSLGWDSHHHRRLHRAPCFIKSIRAMLAYHFHLMSY